MYPQRERTQKKRMDFWQKEIQESHSCTFWTNWWKLLSFSCPEHEHNLTSHDETTINPSPPVLIYIRQSQNVQSFDPSGSSWFYMQKKEEVDLSHEIWKKNLKKIFTMFESELFIPENRSQWPGGVTKYKLPLSQASDSRWVVSSTRRWRIFIVYQWSFSKRYKTLEINIIYRKI